MPSSRVLIRRLLSETCLFSDFEKLGFFPSSVRRIKLWVSSLHFEEVSNLDDVMGIVTFWKFHIIIAVTVSRDRILLQRKIRTGHWVGQQWVQILTTVPE